MADAEASPKQTSGCGIFSAVFGKCMCRSRAGVGNDGGDGNSNRTELQAVPNSRRWQRSSDETAFLEPSRNGSDVPAKQTVRPSSNNRTSPNMYNSGNNQRVVPASTPAPVTVSPNHGHATQVRIVPRDELAELESMITDHQKSRRSSMLVRASSGNVMLYSNLGNLRQNGKGNSNTDQRDAFHNSPSNTSKEEKYRTSVMGNVVKKRPAEQKPSGTPPASLCRVISTRMDPETLKIMGNEDYKNGRFGEALALYDAAIAIEPEKASYRSNKSAALTALGRLLEAIFECREAIRIEPRYQRAHHRLATLYVRLGEAEKAIYHYKLAGPEADPDVLTKAKTIQSYLTKCTEARKQRDWNTLIRECQCAISAGADSAPQIFTLQAEGYLNLRKHQNAEEAICNGPKFDVEKCTKFFGPIGNANSLCIRAQVDMASGRFEDAVEAASRAAELDANGKEANTVMRRARAVAAARSKGNEAFKAGRFNQASVAYEEGLQHDPSNSVLLCNRAACRAKLGQFEKAIEDCSLALNVRPSYSKARLRRADCYAKLKKWEASVQDYEVAMRETPENDEVKRALAEARKQLKGGP